MLNTLNIGPAVTTRIGSLNMREGRREEEDVISLLVLVINIRMVTITLVHASLTQMCNFQQRAHIRIKIW